MNQTVGPRGDGVLQDRAAAGQAPQHPMLVLQHRAGNRAVLGLLRSAGIQPQLTVGAAEDLEEKEADDVAERVMRKRAGSGAGGLCTCAPGEETCEDCRSQGRDDSVGVRRATGTGGGETVAPPIVRQVLDSSGRPLDAAVRTDMEQRFDRDFGAVRVHTDEAATCSAGSIDALAYTAGSQIVFGQGQYAPHSDSGRRLLAHELAHVVQQAGGPTAGIRRQLFTPLAPGGGFSGLLERDRQAAMAPHPDDRAKKIADAIQGGWRDVRDLDENTLRVASVEQRTTMLVQLTQAWWTGGAEERAIIRIIQTTPSGQAADLVNRLDTGKIGDRSYLDQLDDVVNFGNNLELHAELSQLRLKAMGPEKGSKALQEALVLPWNDVMGFFEDDATFMVSETSDHKIRIKYPVRVHSSTDFASEVRKLPFAMFIQGQDYDPAQVFIIHDYETGRFVPVVAKELIGYQNAGIRGFLGHVATVASFALPVSAAESALGKAAVFVLERALPTLFLLIDENRLNLVKWFPKWGPRMIYYADLAKVGVGIYGIGRFAVSGYQLFQSWKSVRQARQALEGASGEASAEQAATAIEKQADQMFEQVDKIQGKEPGTTPSRPGAAEPHEGAVGPHVEHPPVDPKSQGVMEGASKYVDEHPGIIKGRGGERRAPVPGEGNHEIVEVRDPQSPTGIGCEFHSPAGAKIPCPVGMGVPEGAIGGPGDVKGVSVGLTEKQAERLRRVREALNDESKWANVTANDRFRLGRVYDSIMEKLVSEAVSRTGQKVMHYIEIDTATVNDLRKVGGRVLITEGRVPSEGLRIDMVEIDFAKGRAELLDLAATSSARHLEKTRSYKAALEQLLGMPVDAKELYYTGKNGELLETLIEVAVK
jgi:hypothetical protein